MMMFQPRPDFGSMLPVALVTLRVLLVGFKGFMGLLFTVFRGF